MQKENAGSMASRAVIEARFTDLLEQTGRAVTVEDIKTMILKFNHTRFGDYVDYMLGLVESPDSRVNMDVALPVIEDAWNHFPHLSLNGESPAEAFARLGAEDETSLRPPDFQDVEFDADKIDDAVLALLLLGLHGDVRVWKGHDWTALDHLFQKGYITDPASNRKSVMLTDVGLIEAERLFKKLFAR